MAASEEPKATSEEPKATSRVVPMAAAGGDAGEAVWLTKGGERGERRAVVGGDGGGEGSEAMDEQSVLREDEIEERTGKRETRTDT